MFLEHLWIAVQIWPENLTTLQGQLIINKNDIVTDFLGGLNPHPLEVP